MPGLIVEPIPLGFSIPLGEKHACSVSLPTWLDCTDYEKGTPRVVDAMQIGYPRFFVNKLIQKLAAQCLLLLGRPDEACYLFPSYKTARRCEEFLQNRSPPVSARIAELEIPCSAVEDLRLFPVFLPQSDLAIGKQFWQHTGDGISSRFAARCLAAMNLEPAESVKKSDSSSHPRGLASSRGFAKNKHYAKASMTDIQFIEPISTASLKSAEDAGEDDPLLYVEERYGRNLARRLAPLAKTALKRRIAGVLQDTVAEANAPGRFELGQEEAALVQSASTNAPMAKVDDRRISGITEDDVYLHPSGMSAIFHAHQLALKHAEELKQPVGKSVCFGFPYTDTLKILQKWGPGCHHFGNGSEEDLDELENLLVNRPPDEAPILSVFTEFPSNPLLRSCNLHRLRTLANQHKFLLVVDETIGTFVNVEVLPLVDVVVSSLTKVFSGDSNVMGGSLILNPASPMYSTLQQTLSRVYEDTFFDEDALFLERNSRNFTSRVYHMNDNAEQLCDFLRKRRVHSSGKPSVLKEVYYPKFVTEENYRRCMRPPSDSKPDLVAGYGGLFSLTFTSLSASEVFYDNLQCEKGPSLGTNFTLACPYTVLAHWTELEWADNWGVEENLVRVSTGLEDIDTLIGWFGQALDAAERAVN